MADNVWFGKWADEKSGMPVVKIQRRRQGIRFLFKEIVAFNLYSDIVGDDICCDASQWPFEALAMSRVETTDLSQGVGNLCGISGWAVYGYHYILDTEYPEGPFFLVDACPLPVTPGWTDLMTICKLSDANSCNLMGR